VTALFVFLGAGVGGVARYGVGRWLAPVSAGFPWGTLAVNVTGSLLIGALAAAIQLRGLSQNWQMFLTVGLCGGYTTFSAFSAETLTMLQSGHGGRAALYLVASVAGCVLAVLGGMRFGAALLARG